MSLDTKIEWCDSTLNLEMGCTGCELHNPNLPEQSTCYAAALTERYGGKPGWPTKFEEPKIFLERLALAEKWPNLTGRLRPDKPHLDKLPRLIFLNDMGDTFNPKLDADWLTPAIERLEATPHIYQILTKYPERMANFFLRLGRIPKNFWLGVSVTGAANFVPRLGVIPVLRTFWPEVVLFASFEPLLDALPWERWAQDERTRLDWAIWGGESGYHGRPMHALWAWQGMRRVAEQGGRNFFKQWGSWAHQDGLDDAQLDAAAEAADGHVHTWPDGTLSYWVGKGGPGQGLWRGAHVREVPGRPLGKPPQPPRGYAHEEIVRPALAKAKR